jgi:hypothetical protein
MPRRPYQPVIQIIVYCGNCKEWIPETDTALVNLEEGPQGEDILTYICPKCKTEQRSRRCS